MHKEIGTTKSIGNKLRCGDRRRYFDRESGVVEVWAYVREETWKLEAVEPFTDSREASQFPELRWNGEYLESEIVLATKTNGASMLVRAVQYPTDMPAWVPVNDNGKTIPCKVNAFVASWSFLDESEPLPRPA